MRCIRGNQNTQIHQEGKQQSFGCNVTTTSELILLCSAHVSTRSRSTPTWKIPCARCAVARLAPSSAETRWASNMMMQMYAMGWTPWDEQSSFRGVLLLKCKTKNKKFCYHVLYWCNSLKCVYSLYVPQHRKWTKLVKISLQPVLWYIKQQTSVNVMCPTMTPPRIYYTLALVCLHIGLLQVLLSHLLALAALHGHSKQPPAPHAKPEEQGL